MFIIANLLNIAKQSHRAQGDSEKYISVINNDDSSIYCSKCSMYNGLKYEGLWFHKWLLIT